MHGTATATFTFRELLKNSGKFYWDETLEKLFQQSKCEILKSIDKGVRTFEINHNTCLTTDWSTQCIGYRNTARVRP